MSKPTRPDITCIPMSTDAGKIRFFGTLMPALLLIKASPAGFLHYQLQKRTTPASDAASFINSEADDAARAGDVLVFVHRWRTVDFDPFTFARAKSFLACLTRLVRRAGYRAEPLDPLSPAENLPQLAAAAGLGNLSPYGLLVHPIFGPRLILTGLKTDLVLPLAPRWGGGGCDDCLACVTLCPQEPASTGTVDLALCQSCAKCLAVCPTGKGRHARTVVATLPA